MNRILLADDSPLDVELALKALDEYKLANEVVVVRDGVEVMDYLRGQGAFAGRPEGLPAVILMDLKMPRRNGLEALRLIRSDPRLKLIPVVMLTSASEESEMVESYRLGVNAYVVKPVSFPEFVEAVKHLGLFWAVLNEPPPGRLGDRSPPL